MPNPQDHNKQTMKKLQVTLMRHGNAHPHNRTRHHLASKSFYISSKTTITIKTNKPTLYPTQTNLNESQGIAYIGKMRANPKGRRICQVLELFERIGGKLE